MAPPDTKEEAEADELPKVEEGETFDETAWPAVPPFNPLKMPAPKELKFPPRLDLDEPDVPPDDPDDDGFGSEAEPDWTDAIAGAPGPAPGPASAPEYTDEELRARAHDAAHRACVKVAAWATVEPILKNAVAGWRLQDPNEWARPKKRYQPKYEPITRPKREAGPEGLVTRTGEGFVVPPKPPDRERKGYKGLGRF